VGLRAGTVAANRTGSNGTSAFVFFVLAFTTGQSNRKASQPQRHNPSWFMRNQRVRLLDSPFFLHPSAFPRGSTRSQSSNARRADRR
jgi:hypothetical protein